MDKLRTVIKDGTKDLIFGECELKRNISEKFLSIFKKWGYNEVMTPSLEYLNVFSGSGIDGMIKNEDIYKLTDEKNYAIALRADCTMPIARVVATKLSDVTSPYRLCYNQSVFSASKQLHETTQCGVELIGENDIRSDIEILNLAVKSQKEVFNGDFRIEIGHGELFNILVEKFEIDEETAEKAREHIERKNFAAIQAMNLPHEIKILPRMFGDVRVLDEYAAVSPLPEVCRILDYLKELYSYLDGSGYGHCVNFDLGLVNSLDYYTGIIFRGYVSGSGQTVLSGGRYDNLLENYGRKFPAVGFGISVDYIFEVLRKDAADAKKPDCLIFYDRGNITSSFSLADKLVSEGKTILFSNAGNMAEFEEEALKRDIKTLYYYTNEDWSVIEK